jgi:hypothetical protein
VAKTLQKKRIRRSRAHDSASMGMSGKELKRPSLVRNSVRPGARNRAACHRQLLAGNNQFGDTSLCLRAPDGRLFDQVDDRIGIENHHLARPPVGGYVGTPHAAVPPLATLPPRRCAAGLSRRRSPPCCEQDGHALLGPPRCAPSWPRTAPDRPSPARYTCALLHGLVFGKTEMICLAAITDNYWSSLA